MMKIKTFHFYICIITSSLLSSLAQSQDEKSLEPFESSLSVDCRRKCLNVGGNFCIASDFQSGFCCPWDYPTPCLLSARTEEQKGGYCSKDIQEPETDLGLKYWVCPRDPKICNSEEVTLIAKDGV